MNVAEVAFAGTVTEVGTMRVVVLLVRETEVPPWGAAWESVTVQEVLAFEAKLAAVQCREETGTCTVASSVIEVLAEEPFREAWSVTVWPEEIVPAVAVKVAVALPSLTVTDEGTVKLVELELSPTAAPPPPAAPLKLTVQVDDPEELMDVGLQLRELMVRVVVGGVGGRETVN